MFFWMVLASLLGIVMFGNLTDKIKDQDDFVVPVYEAMALNLLQQHAAAERGYAMAMKTNPSDANDYLETADTRGIRPLAVVENTEIEGDNNTIVSFIKSYLPASYKPQKDTRSYFFCVDKNQSADDGDCADDDAVKYIVTLRPVPRRYEGANKMTALRSIAKVSAHSRFFGVLQKAPTPLASGANIFHQPIGAHYYIMTAGVAPANSVYVPDYITCNFPLNDDNSLGDSLEDGRTYMISLTLLSGLDKGENFRNPSNEYCFAEPAPEP